MTKLSSKTIIILSNYQQLLISLGKIFLGIFLFLCLAILFVNVFEYLPTDHTTLAFDWKNIWTGIQGGRIQYHQGLHNPPWSLFILLPLGWLSLKASWGVVTLLTLVVIIASVPKTHHRLIWAISIIIAISSFPTIRSDRRWEP